MKKIYAIMAFGLFTGMAFGQTDTLAYMNFENADTALILNGAPTGNDDPNWINLDFDGIPDGSGGNRPQEWFLIFGYATVDSGNVVLGSSSWLQNFVPGNLNYFISPQLHLGSGPAELKWKSAPRQTPLYLDGYSVVISTTDNFESSFTDTVFRAAQFLGASTDSVGTSPIPQFNWYVFSEGWVHGYDGTAIEYDSTADSTRFIGQLVEHTVDLSSYAGQSIHIAFIHDSDDDNLISIDDIVVTGTDATSVVENALKTSIKLYPNPASELVNLEYELSVSSEIEISITNAEGKVVMNESLGTQPVGTYNTQYDVSDLASGMYTVSIQAQGVSYSHNFVRN